MINGRGYPDTVSSADIKNQEGFVAQPATQSMLRGDGTTDTIINSGGIAAVSGQKILLRASNVSTTHLYTIATTLGVPMKVVGRGAAQLKGPTGEDTTMTVNVLNVAGGQAFDVIIDTTGVPAGTYFLYTTNLANLSNGPQDRGGIMTEININ
jgi:FtsP/CotA-like multicopper oxidase with cupredoxin domain